MTGMGRTAHGVRLAAAGLVCFVLLVLPGLWYLSAGLYIFTPAKQAFLALSALVALILILSERTVTRLRVRPADTVEILLIFFLFWAACSSAFATNIDLAMVALMQWLAAAGAFWIIRRTVYPKVVIAAFALGLGFALIVGYLQIWGWGLPLIPDQYGQVLPTASLGQANYAAQAMMPLAVGGGLLAVSLRKKSAATIFGFIAAAAIVYIWLTESRGAFLASAFALAVGVLRIGFVSRDFARKRAIAIGGGGVSILAAALLLDEAWRTRLAHVFTLGDSAVTVRVHLWKDALKAVLQAPIFGFGPGQFLLRFPEVWSETTAFAVFSGGKHLAESPHQDFLGWALDAGLPGLLALAACAFLVFKQGLAAARENSPSAPWAWAGVAVLLAWLVYGFIDYPLHNPVPMYFSAVTAGLLFPLIPHSEREARNRRFATIGLVASLVAAVALMPANLLRVPSHALALRAQAALEGRSTEARPLAEKALRLSPKNPLAHSIYAQSLMLAGLRGEAVDYDTAIVHFNEALALYPVDFVTRYNLGIALYERSLTWGESSFEVARSEFERVTKLNPWYGRAWYMQASIDAREGKHWSHVRGSLEKALLYEPSLKTIASRTPEFEFYRSQPDLWNAVLSLGERKTDLSHGN